MLELTDDQKRQTVLEHLAQLHEEHFHHDRIAFRVVTVAVTVLLVCNAYLVTTMTSLTQNIWFVGCVASADTLFAGMSSWFVSRNTRHMRWIWRSIIRSEQVLGFYEPGHYISEQEVDFKDSIRRTTGHSTILPERTFPHATVLDPRGANWGNDTEFEYRVTWFATIWLAWTLCQLVLWFGYSVSLTAP